MIRRPPRSTLFPYTDALPISRGTRHVGWPHHRRGRQLARPAYGATGHSSRGYRYTLMTREPPDEGQGRSRRLDRKSTRLNSSHLVISYAVFCLKKKKEDSPTC